MECLKNYKNRIVFIKLKQFKTLNNYFHNDWFKQIKYK